MLMTFFDPHVGPFLYSLSGEIFSKIMLVLIQLVPQDFLRHVQTLPWPARPLYLSPIEHMRDQLKRQMMLCHSAVDLNVAIQDLLARLPQDNVRSLINSMPNPVVA